MSAARDVEETLREVIAALAPIERRAGEPGEQQAADWIAQRLRDAGAGASVEPAEFRDGYATVIRNLASVGVAAGLGALASRRLRRAGGAAAAAATLAIADDISNGPRFFRRMSGRPRPTWNVVAECGDLTAERTLVVLAHHDAAPTGRIFDDRFQAWLGDQFPGILERIDTSLPLWWAILAAPGMVARRRRPRPPRARGRRDSRLGARCGRRSRTSSVARPSREPTTTSPPSPCSSP